MTHLKPTNPDSVLTTISNCPAKERKRGLKKLLCSRLPARKQQRTGHTGSFRALSGRGWGSGTCTVNKDPRGFFLLRKSGRSAAQWFYGPHTPTPSPSTATRTHEMGFYKRMWKCSEPRAQRTLSVAERCPSMLHLCYKRTGQRTERKESVCALKDSLRVLTQPDP